MIKRPVESICSFQHASNRWPINPVSSLLQTATFNMVKGTISNKINTWSFMDKKRRIKTYPYSTTDHDSRVMENASAKPNLTLSPAS